jgi:hypothetical protein
MSSPLPSGVPRRTAPISLLGLMLAMATVIGLALSAGSIGYARDEGVYFEASRHYGTWASRLIHEPGKALEQKQRDRYFRINHEHPALMKTAAGISARLLARPAAKGTAKKKRDVEFAEGGLFPVMDEGAAMRLPAQVLAGFGVFLLFAAGRRYGRSLVGGFLAAGWFILLPRVAFNASLHAFDVPIAVAGLAVVLAYQRAQESPRWAIALGPILGVAIAIKHNALFFGVLLAAHHGLCLLLAWRSGRRPRFSQIFPLHVASMAILAPLVALALWPWMWHDTVARVGEYFAFHGEHSYYNMEFLGENFNRPPLPVSYPLVMTFATVPTALLVLACLGLGAGLRDDLQGPRPALDKDASPSWARPLPPGWPRAPGFLFAMFAAFPLLLISLPTIPIFGGTKHWLTVYPFMALAASLAWSRLWAHASVTKSPRWRHAPAVALILVLVPGAWSTLHGHPYNLSQYAPMIGGARGAANLGLNRGFWGHATVALFDEGAARGPVYLHDIHGLARRQYEREGRWPGWKGGSLSRARSGLIFHEMHTTSEEVQLWNTLDTAAPSAIIELDDVPLTSFYAH